MVGTCLTGYLIEFLGSYRSCTGFFWASNIWESKWWCSRPLLMFIEVMMVILPDLLVIIKWPWPMRPEPLSTSVMERQRVLNIAHMGVAKKFGNRPRISWNSEFLSNHDFGHTDMTKFEGMDIYQQPSWGSLARKMDICTNKHDDLCQQTGAYLHPQWSNERSQAEK